MKLIDAIGLLILALCTSCDKRPDEVLTQMKSPVILLGEAEHTGTSGVVYYNITLKDSVGKIVSFDGYYTISKTIAQSYNVGDTIK